MSMETYPLTSMAIDAVTCSRQSCARGSRRSWLAQGFTAAIVLAVLFTPCYSFGPPRLAWTANGRVNVSSSSGNTISVPLFRGTLRYKLVNVTVKAWAGAVVGTVQTLAYNGIIPGPTIEFKACTQYRLTFVNEAPTEVGWPACFHVHA
jgi:hypothetical protein